MAVSAAGTSINLIGNIPRRLDADTIRACASDVGKSELKLLWERIKDWFFGTHTVAAQNAIHTLASATSTSARMEALLDLTRYIEPSHRDKLQWCIGEGEDPYFKIGDCVIPAAPDWSARLPMHVNIVDMAQLLLCIRHNDAPLLSTFRQIEQDSLAMFAPRTSTLGDADEDTTSVNLDMAGQYLRTAPSLVAALEYIGLHGNDTRNDTSLRLGLQVAEEWRARHPHDAPGDPNADTDVAMGYMAQDVMILVTDMFHERREANQRQSGTSGMR
ncbi:hypothetical protein [Pandoraea anhela]|uniref:Uncharacterized protein n=1 Tax=Pandoraea anhela TaxID=2508295 RepID=A0A5E4T708_9BURK|nr:hypothetical protein [Pandoraea anhela]VVD84046.1 hypothetical protein PAN31108_01267 [Pandoraea anhela]